MAKTEPATQSWRAVIPVHPIANMLPLMSAAELTGLAKDIAAHGLRNPVTLLRKAGRLELGDGRNRCNAAELAGVPVVDADGNLLLPHVIEEADGFDVAAFVLSQNLHRRHLTLKQRCELTGALLQADPSHSDRATARLVGISPTTVGKIRLGLEVTGDVSKLDTRTDTRGRAQPATKPTRPQRRKPKPRDTPPAPAETVAEIVAPPVVKPLPEPETVEVRRVLVSNLDTSPVDALAVESILDDPAAAGEWIAQRLLVRLGSKAAEAHAGQLITALRQAARRAVKEDAPGRKALQRALKIAGSQRKLGKKIGITGHSVWKWHEVPEGQVEAVSKSTGIPPEELRPDLYPPS